jgi:hypothetical protein
MPLLILGLLIIVGAILYMRFIKQDGDPSIEPRPEPVPEEGEPATGAGPTPAAPAQASTASTDPAAAPTAGGANAETPASEQSAAGQPDVGGEDSGFSTMEELTEFYRKEAERITGIKH